MSVEDQMEPSQLPELVPDPAGIRPLGTEGEFDEAVAGRVADSAPRLFAVVQEYGARVDARIAGWGLAHEDHVDVIGEGNSVHLGASRPEDMLRYFHRRDLITARIVWPDPAAATPDVTGGS
jgi:hypothetical protein